MSCRLRPRLRVPLAVVLAAVACATSALANEATIPLAAEQAKLLGIRSEPAAVASGIPLEHLPGTLEPALERSAVVTAPYAGTVTRVLAVEGSEVAAGAPLARVQSRERLLLEADAARTASEARLASSQARRDAALLAEGIVPATRAEASRALQVQTAAAQRQATQALALAPKPVDGAPGEYELRAPLAGRVLERKVVPGQALEALAPAFVVADADVLDVAIRVPANWREQLAPGLTVTIDGAAARGRVLAVGRAVDAASQTIPVRARLDATASLAPGQPVAVTLELPAPKGSLALPRDAVVRHGEGSIVFAAVADGYRAVAVEVLGESASHTIVRGELAAGTPVAISGTSALKALLAPAE